MNDNHLQQIFAHYIEKFEMVNNTEHREYYKWQIVNRFHKEMDIALDSPAEEFSTKLYEIKKMTENLIDSYTQPFQGLVKFAEQEPETVRNMFRELYSDDGGNIKARQERVYNFLSQSHALRDKYYPDSFLYKDDMHSVTGYLFLYDPDHNYIFKASHAQIFADCVEFYDDWGSGASVRLDIYYKMCNQLVEAIKSSKELLTTDASRFENGWGADPDTLYPDPEKHILAFDIIYCCSSYGLFEGISFERPKSKERQLMQERKEKAVLLSKKLELARNRFDAVEQAKEYINTVYAVGETIHHKKFGDGIIKINNGSSITVRFIGGSEKQFGTLFSAGSDIISVDSPEYRNKLMEIKDLLKAEGSVKSALTYAEKEFAPYAEYLD